MPRRRGRNGPLAMHWRCSGYALPMPWLRSGYARAIGLSLKLALGQGPALGLSALRAGPRAALGQALRLPRGRPLRPGHKVARLGRGAGPEAGLRVGSGAGPKPALRLAPGLAWAEDSSPENCHSGLAQLICARTQYPMGHWARVRAPLVASWQWIWIPLGLDLHSSGLVGSLLWGWPQFLWPCLQTPLGLAVNTCGAVCRLLGPDAKLFPGTGLWLAFKPGLRPGLRPGPRAGLRAGLKLGGKHGQPEPARGSHNIHMGMHKSMHMCMCMCMCMFANAHKSTNPSSHVHEDPCMTQLKTLSWHTCTWAGFRLQ